MAAAGNDKAEWVHDAMAKEQQRIDRALSFLSPICEVLQEAGDVMVIKSLDHWPDLGSDLDLYSGAKGSDVVALMRERLNARADERSWGDRLANKWNFIVPGLPELVEVHIGRLGQTGEQVAITNSLVKNSSLAQFGSRTFRVPAPENRFDHQHAAAHVSALLSAAVRHCRHCPPRGFGCGGLPVSQVVGAVSGPLEGPGHLPGCSLRVCKVVSRRRACFAGAGVGCGAIWQRAAFLQAKVHSGSYFPSCRKSLRL